MNLNISSTMFWFCPKYTMLSWKDLDKNLYTRRKRHVFSGCPVFNMLALRIDFLEYVSIRPYFIAMRSS